MAKNETSIFTAEARSRALDRTLRVGMLFFFPVIMTLNLIYEDYFEVGLVTIVALFAIGILAINRSGKTTLAALCLLIMSKVAVVIITFHSEVQTPAPYMLLLNAIGSYYFMQGRLPKLALISLSFGGFLVLNTYQLLYLPFFLPEYSPIVIMFGLIIYTIHLFDQEHIRQRREVEAQNRALEEQKELIRQQAKEIVELQAARHQEALRNKEQEVRNKEEEVRSKEQDIEKLVAMNAAQLQVKERFSAGIDEAIQSENPVKAIRSLQLELRNWNQSDKKWQVLYADFQRLNSDLFGQLQLKHPGLTRSEIEMCGYIRLNLSNKEIAAIKQSTPNTINVMKSRLRKKLNLDSNKEIGPYLAKL